MSSSATWHPKLLDPSHPVRSLSNTFWLWKALLLLIVIGCPGLGYDTSSSHLPYQDVDFDVISGDTGYTSLSSPLKFARWDSVYFLHIAGSGYVYEQEWAFSYVFGKLVDSLTSVFPQSSRLSGAATLAVTAIVLSHIAHYLSVLVLYRLSINVFGTETPQKRVICFLSAALHIISPAGAFLSAPYGEALFSFLNLSGFYIYSSSNIDYSHGKWVSSNAKLLLAAALFAGATTIRSNGILSGVLFACDALLQGFKVISKRSLRESGLRLCFIIIGGCVVALGIAIPQYLAYTQYCVDQTTIRPWCQSFIPSIYSWVQSHYWGVGFLRYWTVSNLPLFLLAAPMLVILFQSGLWGLNLIITHTPHKSPPEKNASPSPTSASPLLPQLAIAQILLASMALTSYHVQIINRISSGYPVWYWFLAWKASEHWGASKPKFRLSQPFSLVAQVMVIYALVQATLFGSFLPPA